MIQISAEKPGHLDRILNRRLPSLTIAPGAETALHFQHAQQGNRCRNKTTAIELTGAADQFIDCGVKSF